METAWSWWRSRKKQIAIAVNTQKTVRKIILLRTVCISITSGSYFSPIDSWYSFISCLFVICIAPSWEN